MTFFLITLGVALPALAVWAFQDASRLQRETRRRRHYAILKAEGRYRRETAVRHMGSY